MSKPIYWVTLGCLIMLTVHCAPEEKKDDAATATASTDPQAVQVKQKQSLIPEFQSIIAQPADQRRSVKLNGRLQPLESLHITAEVQGKAVDTGNKLLNEGTRYRRGETMIRIDDDQFRFDLQAQKSQFQAALVRIMSRIKLDYPKDHPAWDEYLRQFDESQPLPELPEVTDDQLRYFLSANNIFSAFYQIKSAEELLPKYRIQAPFTGVVTQGSVAPGMVINPGTPLFSYSRSDVYELKATVSIGDIEGIKPGMTIEMVQNTSGKSYTGTIHRLGGTIDPSAQAVPVFIRVSSPGLREGLFLEATLQADRYASVVALPLSSLNRKNQVHVIQDSVVILQDVDPVDFDQDSVWVQGLQQGQPVITEPVQEPIVGTRAIPKT